MFIQRIIMLS